MMNDPYVKYSVENSIGTIEFFHPKSNSLPSNLLAQLTDAFKQAGADDHVKIIVLRSAGEKAFCAGASFDELLQIDNEKDGLAFFSGFANVINSMRTCNKLVIARVQGKCVGGGVGLASAADFAIAKNEAAVKLSELSISIGPFVISPAVERKIGKAGLATLAIDAANFYDAEWALQKGLFNKLANSTQELDAEVNKLSGFLSACSADAMRELKTNLWQGTEHWDKLLYENAAISGRLVLSDFTKAALAKFKN